MTEMPDFSVPQPAPNSEKLFATPDAKASRDTIPIPDNVKKAVGSLGNNRKGPRTGPRKLTDSDKSKIVDYYEMLAWAVKAFKPAVHDAIMAPNVTGYEDGHAILGPSRAVMCAEAWCELAEENDKVRRLILMLVEGGAWSKVFMMNLPILMAALPEDILMRAMTRFMPSNEWADPEAA